MLHLNPIIITILWPIWTTSIFSGRSTEALRTMMTQLLSGHLSPKFVFRLKSVSELQWLTDDQIHVYARFWDSNLARPPTYSSTWLKPKKTAISIQRFCMLLRSVIMPRHLKHGPMLYITMSGVWIADMIVVIFGVNEIPYSFTVFEVEMADMKQTVLA